jgi:diguanylate cyclase (GGDEF)-like protein/PAS domain S-box-containing protein
VGELRVLIVEDSEDDAQLLVRELRKGGFELTYERVETAETLEAALCERQWEIVLSDYALPSFNGMEALGVVRGHSPDLPLILISGKVGEDIAAEAMRCGAQDFILKGNLSRLAPAIKRELVEFEVRRERKEALAALCESKARYRMMVSSLAEGVIVTDPGGRVETFNNSALEILGVSGEELRRRILFDAGWEAIHENGSPIAVSSSMIDILRSGIDKKAMTLGISRPDGSHAWILVNVRPQKRQMEAEPSGFLLSFSDITLRKYAEDHLRHISIRDALTAVNNRAYFEEELSRLDRGRRMPVSVIVADVDGLKAVNDTHGHAAGDEVLRRTAAALQSCIRAEDVVARIGGDEFAVLLPQADARVARQVIGRIRDRLARFDARTRPLATMISLGAATAERPGELQDALRLADKRMYEDKRRRSSSHG